MVQVPRITSWAKRAGRAALLFAAVSLVTNTEEFSRQIVSAETSGAVTLAKEVIQLGSGSVSGGSKGICETTDGLCNEMSSRAKGVSDAITGNAITTPSTVVNDIEINPSDNTGSTTSTVPSLESPSTVPSTTEPTPETTATTELQIENSLIIGPLVCSNVLSDVTMGDNPTPGHAVASLSPDLEGGWAKVSVLFDYVMEQPSNAGLPVPERFTTETVIHDVPKDCR